MDEYDRYLVAELISDPEAVRRKLGDDDGEQLDVLTDLLAEGGDARRLAGIARAVVAHLRRALPEDSAGLSGRRLVTATESEEAAWTALISRFAFDHGVLDHGAFDATADLESGQDRGRRQDHTSARGEPPGVRWSSARERILAEPALTAAELEELFGVVSRQANLIRLPVPDGPDRLPAFQFDGGGQPRPVVLAVNALLGATVDPWGVADWWLGPNMWLDAAPAALLGAELDGQLLAAARVVGEDD